MEFAPQQYESFLKDREGFFEQLDAMGETEQLKALRMIKSFIEMQRAGKVDFETCVKAAFDHYCRDFVTSIRDLVHTCDQIEQGTGKPFWTGTKRKPVEAEWDPKAPPAEALEYLYACANCYAFIWKVPFVRNREEFERLVLGLELRVPAWAPAGGEAKVDTEEEAAEKADPAAIEALKAELGTATVAGLQPCQAHDFEKDDDTNFHIDFLTVGTNLRAANYDIKRSERAHVKVTAGRIIPALATTTAMICGLVDMEFMKLVKGLHKGEQPLDKFYNANINLATGSQAMNVFRPEPPVKRETKLPKLPEYTTWDKVNIKGEVSLKQLVEELQTRYDATVRRLYPAGDDKICVFDSSQHAKLGWKIEVEASGQVTIEPDEVYTAWPQLRMAMQMLQRVPEGAARNNFLNQVRAAAKSLQSVKESFTARLEGPASEAYIAVARPQEDAEKQKYFDAVLAKRRYIALQAHLTNATGEDADLPLICYTFRG